MRRALLIVGWGLGFLLVLALAYLLLSSSTFHLEGSSLQDGSLTVETKLPFASCTRRLSAELPHFTIHCDWNAKVPPSETP